MLEVESTGAPEQIVRVPFPEIDGGKIPTVAFLAAAKEVVRIVEKLGRLFAPVRYDMQGNIDKLNARFAAHRENSITLQDIVLDEATVDNNGNLVATDALLWLTRALHMILLFFEKIVEDHKTEKPSEELIAILRQAYQEALEPYHSWVAQQLFSLLSRAVPAKTDLLRALADGRNISGDAVLQEMEVYLINLRRNVVLIQTFYSENNIMPDARA